MSHAPFEHAESLRIGIVDFVSPDELKVSLDIETPESIALNAGGPRPFPRVNSYVLVPVEDAFIVGQVAWLTIERSPFPKRRGMQDFGLIDLPYPLRKMSINPLGTLRRDGKTIEAKHYIFQRGTEALPSVGVGVLLPTDEQLRSIVESGEKRRVKIGTSPMASNAEVCIDPDRLFGRHLAVLGNTGSGKSCSVAGLIRWSLERASHQKPGVPNARFIVLDPNGEYSRAFADPTPPMKAKLFKVNPDESLGELQLMVPLWFWNSAEWCSFTQASAKTQRPTLIQALRAVKDGLAVPEENQGHVIRRYLRTIISTVRMERNSGTPWGTFPRPKNFFEKLEKWKEGLELKLQELQNDEHIKLNRVVEHLETLCSPRRVKYALPDFTMPEIEELLQILSEAHSQFGGTEKDSEPFDGDAPRYFEGDDLLRSVEATAEMLNVSEHAETLLIRIRSILANTIVQCIVSQPEGITLKDWLDKFVGKDNAEDGCISVLDLSLVPTEVVHIVTSVVARMIFEALQRYRKLNNIALPTVLVMEEAHTFVKRYKDDAENQDAASVCCRVFERIAREGRKFGLGLVLSSQRPSELSPTVLSQCNTFLLHRISNDQDQQLVHSLVPDNLRGLLRELPSLPSQNAILLGWASELPLLVKMNDLPRHQQPHSDDPDFWNVWTGKDSEGNSVSRFANWQPVADEWQGISPEPSAAPSASNAPAPIPTPRFPATITDSPEVLPDPSEDDIPF